MVITAMPNYPTGVVIPGDEGHLLLIEEIERIPVIRKWIYAATGNGVLRRLAKHLSFCCTCVLGCFKAPRPTASWSSRCPFLFVAAP